MRSRLSRIQRSTAMLMLAAVVSVVAGAQVAEACAGKIYYSNASTNTHYSCTLVRYDMFSNQCFYSCKQAQLLPSVDG